MESEWEYTTLGECADWYSGGTPRKSCPQYWDGDIPWISAKSLKDFHVWNSEVRVTSEGLENGTRLVPTDAILLVVRGMSLKSEFRLGVAQRPVSFNQDIKAIVAKDDYLPYFLAYILKGKTAEILDLVEEAGHGTGVLPTDVIKNIEIPVISKAEQKGLVEIFQTIDDKIELNRRMNATLEGMAQALFKSWFVDFDPVIDNALAAGNPIPDELAPRAEVRKKALGERSSSCVASQKDGAGAPSLPEFPATFQFTEELGWIPEGWNVVRFDELVSAKQGRYLAKTEMVETADSRFKYPAWGGNGILGFSSSYAYDEPITLMTCRGSNCGLIKFTESSAWISNNSFACPTKYGSQYFLYIYFKNESFEECVSGSAQPQITYTALKNKVMKFPISEPICEQFSNLVQSYKDRQAQNASQNETLTNLRDTLLPKLISGELRIAEVEQLTAEIIV